MPSIQPIALDLQLGLIATYLAGNSNSTLNALKGGNIDNRLPRMLYMEQAIIQNIYNLNPNDSNLRLTTNYLYYLYGIYGRLAQNRINQINQGILSITNPVGFFATVGQNAPFSVTVTSSTPYTIQWFLNGVAIPGATSTTYTFMNAQLTDSGDTFSATATNAAGSVSSTNAILTVTQPITAQYYYGSIDFYAALQAGTDNVPYQGTIPILHNQPISVPWPLAAVNNMYNVIKYPATESIKASYFNTSANFGNIPNPIFHPILTINGFNYIITSTQVSWNSVVTTVIYT